MYIGEMNWPGQLGHLAAIVSLIASALSAFAYWKANPINNDLSASGWKRIARTSFYFQVGSVFLIFFLLLFLIHNHRFEYHYAWKHSSKSLEFKYLLASIWEGQEGSFLLWLLWQGVLGLILIRTSRNWEAPVMSIVSFAQFCLSTMIIGISLFGWKLGSSPFILLRDSGVLDNAPALHLDFDTSQPLIPNYLEKITDGNDLNPLLQNYWMVIHPPVLFLGFASTLIPFAFAIGGVMTRQYTDWVKPVQPWALFSTAVLGVGIMMGGMWAYESLTFGGYWAWDPVENASLVPWLIGVAGLHTLLIYRHSGQALHSTILFFVLTFGFILYSTFLTRSGILGETSVHAFTGEGMNLQLLALIAVFMLPSAWLLITRNKEIPRMQTEENISSREFWMYIGSLLFFLSAILIIGQTSLPVFNKIFGTTIAPPEDVEFSYNSVQIYIAIVLALLTGFTYYLKYKQTDKSLFWKRILIPLIISVVLGAGFAWGIGIHYTQKGPGFQTALWISAICSLFSLIANASYIWIGIKGNLAKSGGAIAHVGFALTLLGIVVTSSNKQVISENNNGFNTPLGKGENPRENLTLIQGVPAEMGRYTLTFEKDSAHPQKKLWYYNVRFKSKDGKEEFVLQPNAFVNYKGNKGLMANPDAKHYWDHDVFTYVTSLPDPEASEDTTKFKPNVTKAGDTLFFGKGFIVVGSAKIFDSVPEDIFGKDGRVVELPVTLYRVTGESVSVTLKAAEVKKEWIPLPDTLQSDGVVLQLQELGDAGSYTLGIKESDQLLKYVTLKAFHYPYIQFLWFGIWLTAAGLLISTRRRMVQWLKERTN
jgi:cytochrome c-type biogenesis protein CcmF